jgi:hypothetical protein
MVDVPRIQAPDCRLDPDQPLRQYMLVLSWDVADAQALVAGISGVAARALTRNGVAEQYSRVPFRIYRRSVDG